MERDQGDQQGKGWERRYLTIIAVAHPERDGGPLPEQLVRGTAVASNVYHSWSSKCKLTLLTD